MKLLSQKQLYKGDWLGYPVTPKTWRKDCKRWGMRPVAFDGRQPLFDEEEVKAGRQRRQAARLAKWESD